MNTPIGLESVLRPIIATRFDKSTSDYTDEIVKVVLAWIKSKRPAKYWGAVHEGDEAVELGYNQALAEWSKNLGLTEDANEKKE